MRSSRVVRASDSQFRSRNCPGFDPSILRYNGIWGAADEAVLNIAHKKKKTKKSPISAFLISDPDLVRGVRGVPAQAWAAVGQGAQPAPRSQDPLSRGRVSSQQCCGSGSAWIHIILITWIRIKKNLDPSPRPDPHQKDKLDPEPDPDPHLFADDKPKCIEYEPILARFKGFEPLLGS